MSARSSSTRHGSVLFTSRPSRRRRRTWLGSQRRIGLGLSLVLVGAALAVPAAADSDLKTFEAVVTGELVDNTPDRFDLTVTLTNTTQGGGGLELGSANIGIAGGLSDIDDVDVDLRNPASATFDGDATIEARRLGLEPHGGVAVITFRATVDECSAERDYTFTVDAKQSNSFNGDGNALTLTNPEDLTVVLDCAATSPAYTDGLEDACGDGDCRLEVGDDQTFTASAPGGADRSLLIGVRTPGDDEFAIPGEIAEAFKDQCQAIVDDPSLTGGRDVRLADAVFQFQPSGFTGDGQVRIDMVIPRSIVNRDQNRSADAFGVCFLGESNGSDKFGDGHPLTDAASFSIDDGSALDDDSVPDLYGPVLLPLCADGYAAPCIERREKVRSDVQITVVAPAEDPWMR